MTLQHQVAIKSQRWRVLLFLCYSTWNRIADAFSPAAGQNSRSSTHLLAGPVVAVVGGDLAGVVAASKIATESPTAEVLLLTGLSNILEGFKAASSPILPDLALENRILIERYGGGGRELAGILAKKCTPLQAKEWLEEQGVILQDESSTMTALLNEKPLFVSPKCDLQQVLQDHLERAQVAIQTNVNVTSISCNKPGFILDLERGEPVKADVVILANDCREIPPTPILAAKATDTTTSSKSKAPSYLDLDFDDDEPLSLKDQMKLEKKRKSDAKKKKMDQLVQADEINVNELSKQELRTLTKKRKKEAQKNKKRKYKANESPTSSGESDPTEDAADNNDSADEESSDVFSFQGIDTAALAQKIGHTVTKESLGCFSFIVPDRGALEGCSKSIVPKARVRCKVENVPKGRAGRLPKLESPLLISQGEVSGPGASRLSTLIAHEMAHSGNRGTLHVHFAPDVGSVQDLAATLLAVADPASSVLKSDCPLVHREVDYDDYDFETGDFRSVEFPLVPKDLWGNLCRQAGITVAKLKWKEVPPCSVQNLARLLVDCQLPITGIRPQESVMAGGVCLKELNMGECQSQLVPGLFLCGSTIDVHGFDGGFTPLAALATGFVAGGNAAKAVKETSAKTS